MLDASVSWPARLSWKMRLRNDIILPMDSRVVACCSRASCTCRHTSVGGGVHAVLHQHAAGIFAPIVSCLDYKRSDFCGTADKHITKHALLQLQYLNRRRCGR